MKINLQGFNHYPMLLNNAKSLKFMTFKNASTKRKIPAEVT